MPQLDPYSTLAGMRKVSVAEEERGQVASDSDDMKSVLLVDIGLLLESLNSQEMLAWGLAVFSVHVSVYAVPSNNVAEVSVVSLSSSAFIISIGVLGLTVKIKYFFNEIN